MFKSNHIIKLAKMFLGKTAVGPDVELLSSIHFQTHWSGILSRMLEAEQISAMN